MTDRIKYQGHAAIIHSVDEAMAARNALFQNHAVAISDSIMYAYKVLSPNGDHQMGFCDDRDWLGGSSLLQILERNDHQSFFLAVSRSHSGPGLGQRRSALIKEVACEALEMEKLKITTDNFE